MIILDQDGNQDIGHVERGKMKKIIRLTESDLTRIVKRVILEQSTCGDEYKNFQCPKGTIRGEHQGVNDVQEMAKIIAQNNWMKSKGISSYNFSGIMVVESIQCNEGGVTKCIVCINEPGTKVKPQKIKMKDFN